MSKSKKEDVYKKKEIEKVEHKLPLDYLNSITTTIDCEKDLELYKIDKCVSTEKMSVVGIQIISM